MPNGCNVKDAQQPDADAPRSEKADDLSMDDWNFLLRFQVSKVPGGNAHVRCVRHQCA